MPNTKSAKKALRVSIVRRKVNLARTFKIKTALKNLRKGIVSTPNDSNNLLAKAYSALDKAVKTNLIHRNRANRKKSRLAALVARTLTQSQN
jgi:small subunit ribosomal protein S20